jgi:hypothetical protein
MSQGNSRQYQGSAFAQSAKRWSCDATIIVTRSIGCAITLTENILFGLICAGIQCNDDIFGVRCLNVGSHPRALLQANSRLQASVKNSDVNLKQAWCVAGCRDFVELDSAPLKHSR